MCFNMIVQNLESTYFEAPQAGPASVRNAGKGKENGGNRSLGPIPIFSKRKKGSGLANLKVFI